MTNMESSQSSQQTGYKLMLVLLVTMAALSSALRDLSHLQELVANMQGFASEWFGDGLVSVNAGSLSLADDSCNESAVQTARSTEEFRWSGRIAPEQVIEIKGLHRDISAEAGSGSEAELIASKKGRRSDANAVEIKVVEHAGGVTICALYPTDDPSEINSFTCKHLSGTIGAGGRELILKTLNGSINLRRAG